LASAFGSGAGRLGRRLQRGLVFHGLGRCRQSGRLIRVRLSVELDGDGSHLGRDHASRAGQRNDQRQEKRKSDGVDDASINEKDRDGDALQVDHGSEERNLRLLGLPWNRN